MQIEKKKYYRIIMKLFLLCGFERKTIQKTNTIRNGMLDKNMKNHFSINYFSHHWTTKSL